MKLTAWSRTKMTLALLQLPFILLFTVIKLSLGLKKSSKRQARVLFDVSAYFVLEKLDAQQLQAVSVPTLDSYKKWAKDAQQDTRIDELDSTTRLFWVGAKSTQKVLVYCHGGGFVGPLSDFQVAFWHKMQQSLPDQTLSVAVLEYTLFPATFPTQVNQLALAVQHVISQGVDPSNIYLAGDSAGGNLVLQYLLSIIHPIPEVISTPHPTIPFAGACLVSPWLFLSGPANLDSHKSNATLDVVPLPTLEYWASLYLAEIPDAYKAYADQAAAPADWLAGLDKVVKRVLVTAGNDEVMRDDIARFVDTLKGHHERVEAPVLEGETHADALFDFAAKPTELSEGGKRVLEWLKTE